MPNTYETTEQRLPSIWKLVISVIVCELTGVVSSIISQGGMNPWFDTLAKPSWNPPAYLFAPVWTGLYLLMGFSLWLVWKSNSRQPAKGYAMLFFALQLLANFWWSILFFKFHSLSLALMDLTLLFILILITIFRFASISRRASWLLVPYLAWVSFAFLLNFMIYTMNR